MHIAWDSISRCGKGVISENHIFLKPLKDFPDIHGIIVHQASIVSCDPLLSLLDIFHHHDSIMRTTHMDLPTYASLAIDGDAIVYNG